jgi:hypothetical protein
LLLSVILSDVVSIIRRHHSQNCIINFFCTHGGAVL